MFMFVCMYALHVYIYDMFLVNYILVHLILYLQLHIYIDYIVVNQIYVFIEFGIPGVKSLFLLDKKMIWSRMCK